MKTVKLLNMAGIVDGIVVLDVDIVILVDVTLTNVDFENCCPPSRAMITVAKR